MAAYTDGTAALCYLRLGEQSGDMTDYSGNGHHFHVFGSSGTRGVTGLVAGDTDKAYSVDTLSFSMHCYLFQESWMQFTTAYAHKVIVAPTNVGGLAWKTIMRRANPVEWLALKQISGASYAAHYECALSGGGNLVLDGTTQVTAGSGTAMKIMVSWAGVGQPVKLWVNDVVEASSVPASAPTRGSTYCIGTWDQANYTYPFTGVIDEYAFYGYDASSPPPTATKRVTAIHAEALTTGQTTARRLAGIHAEALTRGQTTPRRVAGVHTEVLIAGASTVLDRGVVGAGSGATTVLIKQADGSWRAVYSA